MSADPPVREDGLCVVCLEPREPNRSRRYGRAEAETDPFCSTQCCRAWHEAGPPERKWGDVTLSPSRSKLRKREPSDAAASPQSPPRPS